MSGQPRVALSPTHSMLAQIERKHDAIFVNAVANHPDVAPFVRGYLLGKMDFGEAVKDPNTVFLAGEHGVMIFHQHQPGLWECHTMVKPSGRGFWTLKFVRACLFWVFTKTNAIEIMTRVPKGNIPALALVRAIKGVYEFMNRRGWVMDNDLIPAEIYSMHVQNWIRDADGLRERGAWFHARLEKEMARFGSKPEHQSDPEQNRHVGAACEMIFGGQPHKGVVFYNRYAAMNDLTQASLIGVSPVSVDIGIGVLVMRDGDFWLAASMAA